MPHAENQQQYSNVVNEYLTNGDKKASSQFLGHLRSYPVVHDTVETYMSVPLGNYTVCVARRAYDSLARPLLPYFEGPYSIVAPYVRHADQLADKGLTQLDHTFPVMRETPASLRDRAWTTMTLPVRLLGQGKDYLFRTYEDERRRTGGDGVVPTGKAVVSTELRVAVDVLDQIAAFLGSKKEQAKHQYRGAANRTAEYRDEAMNKYGDYRDEALGRYGDFKDDASKKYGASKDEASKTYGAAKDETLKTYIDYKDDASRIIADYRDEAKKMYGDTKDEAKKMYGDTKDETRRQLGDKKDETKKQFGDKKESVKKTASEKSEEAKKQYNETVTI